MNDSRADIILYYIADKIIGWVLLILLAFVVLFLAVLGMSFLIDVVGAEPACILGSDGLEYCR